MNPHLLRTLAVVATLTLALSSCRRPDAPEEKVPSVKEAPEEQAAPSPPLADDDVVAPAPDQDLKPSSEVDEGIIQEGGDRVERQLVTTARPNKERDKRKIAPPQPEDILREKLHDMRRSVDRRLLWARHIIERRQILEKELAGIEQQQIDLALTSHVPVGADTAGITALIKATAKNFGLPVTDLRFEDVPPDVRRLPDVYSGDKPMTLTDKDLVGTLRISFVLGTEDKERLSLWYDSFRTLPRLIIVNRLRHTGESFQVIADAFYLSDREGPLRREQGTDISEELTRVGVELTAEEVRHKDADHFLLATEISMKELGSLLKDANEAAAVEARLRRAEVIFEWFTGRLKARSGRSLERLLR